MTIELKIDIFKRANEAGKLAGERHESSGKSSHNMNKAFLIWLHSNVPQTEAMYRQFAEGYDERNKCWTQGNDD